MVGPKSDAYGGSVSGGFAAGVANLQVLRPNMRRKKVIFVNDSANIIYLSKTANAVVGSGVRLNAAGGNLVDEPDETGYIWKGAWFCIATGAASNLSWQEDF